MRQVIPSETRNRSAGTMWLAWLIAGTLDLAAAAIQTHIAGRDPLMMLKFIASGVFGTKAFAGGTGFALAGALFHYIIALIWTVLFFLLYPRWKFLQQNVWVTGVVYGLFVWLVMNRIVLPLSNAPPLPFTLKGSLISSMILICAIGIPLSLIARKYSRVQ